MSNHDDENYHEPTREELAALNNIAPLTSGKTEPMLLIDLSSSELDGAAPDRDKPSRIDVILEALPIVIEALESEDSEAADKAAAGEEEEEGGGVYTLGFSDRVTDYGDVNSDNYPEKKRAILADLGGGTIIVPGWEALKAHYDEEFGSRDEISRPDLAALIVTDGEAEDADKFGKLLEQQGDHIYVAVAIVGYGKRHDRTVAQYTEIAKRRGKNLRVLTFDSVTNPRVIARSLLALLGK